MSDDTRCTSKSGMFSGRCRLDGLHPGDHDNGSRTWPRNQVELDILAATIREMQRMDSERAARAELLDRNRRHEI